MFTGIVEEVGHVVSCEQDQDIYRLALRATRVLDDLAVGGSVAVDGCCLTATSVSADGAR
ncbi:MAG: riboflavin synthase, partial [Vicinamibacteria bacterium]|nr:riboflavin synthase [Vicinamibacteria bacterium]